MQRIVKFEPPEISNRTISFGPGTLPLSTRGLAPAIMDRLGPLVFLFYPFPSCLALADQSPVGCSFLDVVWLSLILLGSDFWTPLPCCFQSGHRRDTHNLDSCSLSSSSMMARQSSDLLWLSLFSGVSVVVIPWFSSGHIWKISGNGVPSHRLIRYSTLLEGTMPEYQLMRSHN